MKPEMLVNTSLQWIKQPATGVLLRRGGVLMGSHAGAVEEVNLPIHLSGTVLLSLQLFEHALPQAVLGSRRPALLALVLALVGVYDERHAADGQDTGAAMASLSGTRSTKCLKDIIGGCHHHVTSD